MPDTKIVAIVNSYNRLPLLKVALPSLVEALQASSHPSAVVVFEAGSTDGSIEWLTQYCADRVIVRVEVVLAGNNDNSFSAGVNSACAYAAEQFPHLKYYLLFETDNWLASAEPLLKAIDLLESEPTLAAVGFTVQNHAGRRIGYGCRFPTALSFVLGQQLSSKLNLEHRKVQPRKAQDDVRWHLYDVVYTSPLLVKKEAWQESGGFDAKEFPFSDCDLDWAWRLHKAKLFMAVIDAEEVVHDNQSSLSEWSATRVVTFHRARLKLLQIHRGRWVVLLKPLLAMRHLLEYLLLLVTARKSENYAASLGKRRTLLQTVFHGYNKI